MKNENPSLEGRIPQNLRIRVVFEGCGPLFEEETKGFRTASLLRIKEVSLPPSFLRREETEPPISFLSLGEAPEGGEILEVQGITLPRPLHVVSKEILLVEAFIKSVFLPLKAEVFLYEEWR